MTVIISMKTGEIKENMIKYKTENKDLLKERIP